MAKTELFKVNAATRFAWNWPNLGAPPDTWAVKKQMNCGAQPPLQSLQPACIVIENAPRSIEPGPSRN
ncbi:hypothetical protein SH449x_001121 [Pirellulaceae bacterium SH449]